MLLPTPDLFSMFLLYFKLLEKSEEPSTIIPVSFLKRINLATFFSLTRFMSLVSFYTPDAFRVS